MNTITICKDKYKNQEDFENAIKKTVMVLLDNDYIMMVRYDEPNLGIVCINFESNDQTLGAEYPYWLSPTEWESVVWDDEVNDNE